METRYGFTVSQWDAAKKEIKNILIKVAKEHETIPYSDLVNQLTTPIHLDADSYALANMLGEISIEENARGRGMLSVVVVHKEGDMQPGLGFFELAESLGRNITDREKCWIDELNMVFDKWK